MNKCIFVISLILSSNVYALDYIGQPNADINDPHIKIGLNYSTSEIDVELDDVENKIKNNKQNKYYIDFSFPIEDAVEIILRLGMSNAQPDKGENKDNIFGYFNESNDSFLFGGGIKATIYKNDFMKWGFTAMISYSKYSWDYIDDFRISDVNYYDFEADAPLIEAIIFTGPTFKLTEYLDVYGGPFFHIVSGNFDAEGTIEYPPGNYYDVKNTYDFRQDDVIGGMVGVQFNIGKNICFNIEGQKTNSAEGIAGGMTFKF